MTLIPFAGYDPADRPFGGSRIVPTSRNGKHSASCRMFKAGKDTARIASAIDVDEHLVERWVTLDRCKRLGLPNPYEATK